MSQVNGEASPNILGNPSDWLPSVYTPGSYFNVSSKSAEIYTINKGKERGRMFKIYTGGYVFSYLFDSGAEISCMNMDTVATLSLMGQMTKSFVSGNTANGQDMVVSGDI